MDESASAPPPPTPADPTPALLTQLSQLDALLAQLSSVRSALPALVRPFTHARAGLPPARNVRAHAQEAIDAVRGLREGLAGAEKVFVRARESEGSDNSDITPSERPTLRKRKVPPTFLPTHPPPAPSTPTQPQRLPRPFPLSSPPPDLYTPAALRGHLAAESESGRGVKYALPEEREDLVDALCEGSWRAVLYVEWTGEEGAVVRRIVFFGPLETNKKPYHISDHAVFQALTQHCTSALSPSTSPFAPRPSNPQSNVPFVLSLLASLTTLYNQPCALTGRMIERHIPPVVRVWRATVRAEGGKEVEEDAGWDAMCVGAWEAVGGAGMR